MAQSRSQELTSPARTQVSYWQTTIVAQEAWIFASCRCWLVGGSGWGGWRLKMQSKVNKEGTRCPLHCSSDEVNHDG